MAYVKPHGALYSAVVGHEAPAAAVVVAAVAQLDPGLPVVGLPGAAAARRRSRSAGCRRRSPTAAESVCVHGDSPGAVAMARAVRAALRGAGVDVRAFA